MYVWIKELLGRAAGLAAGAGINLNAQFIRLRAYCRHRLTARLLYGFYLPTAFGKVCFAGNGASYWPSFGV